MPGSVNLVVSVSWNSIFLSSSASQATAFSGNCWQHGLQYNVCCNSYDGWEDKIIEGKPTRDSEGCFDEEYTSERCCSQLPRNGLEAGPVLHATPFELLDCERISRNLTIRDGSGSIRRFWRKPADLFRNSETKTKPDSFGLLGDVGEAAKQLRYGNALLGVERFSTLGIEDGQCIVEAGTNLGEDTFLLSSMMPKSRIWTFEPDLSAF